MFAMHSVPVKATVTKLSMVPPQAQRMVIGGSPPLPVGVGVGVWVWVCGCGRVGVGVKFHPGYDATKLC